MGLSKKTVLITTLVLLLTTGSAYGYYRMSDKAEEAKTTSNAKTAQPDYTGGEERKSNSGGGVNQGGAVDTGGIDVPRDIEGITSESGVISIKQPSASEQLSSGSTVSGTAEGVDTVQYRLLDNKVGLIAQGSLKVVDGAFSGTLQFESYADSGRLDVFNFNSSGEEVNYVEVPVGFKE